MFKKFDSGFILLDLLLALSCLIIITTFFYPFIQDIIKQFQNSEMKLLSEEIMFEEIIENGDRDTYPHTYTVQIDGYEFHLSFEIEKNHLATCIEWYNAKSNLESMCHYVPDFIQ